MSSSYNPGDFFTLGLTTITYYAEDDSGNTNEASFTVIVVDSISPAINDLPASITQNTDDGSCGAIVNWTLLLQMIIVRLL